MDKSICGTLNRKQSNVADPMDIWRLLLKLLVAEGPIQEPKIHTEEPG